MLEQWIIRTYRKLRDARRERRAAPYDEYAEMQDRLADLFEETYEAQTRLLASRKSRAESFVSLVQHRSAAAGARQKAADIRAGRR